MGGFLGDHLVFRVRGISRPKQSIKGEYRKLVTKVRIQMTGVRFLEGNSVFRFFQFYF